MTPNALLSIDVHLGPDDLAAALRRDVADGLSRTPKQLPPKWFYDARGSQLFDEITRLADYYPTRREREILEREAATIAALSGADTIIELGSGTSDKTRLLLDAFVRRRQLERFVPFDVDEATLREAGTALARAYPEVSVRAVVGDFEHHLHHLPTGGRRMVAFLGSTIGNLVPEQRAQFFRHLRSVLDPGDSLLLGADLVKDPARLVAAYDDAEGVTAEFNRNVLHVINRELAADFRPDRFEHVAVWDPDQEWIEMRLRSTDRQSVRLDRLDTSVTFSRGEEIRTEISAKFRASTVIAELEAAGFDLSAWWIDRAGDFALSLSTIR